VIGVIRGLTASLPFATADLQLAIDIAPMADVINAYLSVIPIDAIDNSIIADADAVQMLGSGQLERPARKGIVLQRRHVFKNAPRDGRRQGALVLLDGLMMTL
jgi:hypothetical protein